MIIISSIIVTFLLGLFALKVSWKAIENKKLFGNLKLKESIIIALMFIAMFLSYFEKATQKHISKQTLTELSETKNQLTETLGQLFEARQQLNNADAQRERQNTEMRDLLINLAMANVDLQTQSPFKAWINFRIGNLFYLLRSMEESIRFYDLQLRYTPKHPPTLFNKAIASFVLRRKSEGLSALKNIPLELLRQSPRDIVQKWIRYLDTGGNRSNVKITKEDWKVWWFPTTGMRGGYPNPQ